MKKLLTIFFILIAFISNSQGIKIHDLPPVPNKDSTEFIVSKIVSSVWHSYKIPIDSIQSRCYQLTVHDDSVIRWCTCDTCIDMTVKGGSQLIAECARGMDTAYKTDDSTIRFCRQDVCWEVSLRGSGIDSIWRVPGIDSFYWSKLGVTYSVLDSTGEFKQEIVNSQDIYHENVEWPTSTNVGNIDPASPTFPCSGSVSIEGTTVGEGDYIAFTPVSMPTLADYNYLVFKISSKGHWNPGQRLRLRWVNGSTPVGVGVYFSDGSYGFKSSLTDSCQLIYVPMAAFGDISAATTFRIVGSINTGGTIGYFIDDIIIIQSNINPIIGAAVTWDQTMRNSPDISKDYFSHFNSTIWTMDSITQLRIHVQDWVDIIGDKDAGREYMLKMHVNDAGNSLMAFANATIANGRFAPLILGYQSPFPSPTTGADLSFRGLVHPDNDISGDPVFQFVGVGTHDDTDPNAPPLYMVNTKDIFAIGDSDLQYFMVKASGQLQFPMYVGGAFTGTVAYGLGLDALGNVIVTDTSSGGGGGSADRFGLEDVTTPSARTVDMQENSFILNNSPYNGFYDNTADAIFEVYFPTSGSAIYLTSAENNISAAGNNNISGTTNNLTGNANTIRSTGANPNIFLDAIGSGSGAGKISIRAADNTPTTGAVLHTDFITNWDNTNRDFQFPKASGTFVLSINGNLADSTGNVTISTGISSETDAIALAKTITENDGYGLIETQTATQALSTNPSWTRRIDTFAIETRDRGLKIADSLSSIIATKGTGTVTSVATNTATGITGGTITTTGTLAIDTFLIETRARGLKIVDSIKTVITTAGSAALNSGQIGFGSASNLMTSSSSLLYNSASTTLSVPIIILLNGGNISGATQQFTGLSTISRMRSVTNVHEGNMSISTGGGLDAGGAGGQPTSVSTSPGMLFANASVIAARVSIRGITTADLSAIFSTGGVGHSYTAFEIGQMGVKLAASGTHALLAQQVIRPLTVTSNGTSVVTDITGLYVSGVSSFASTNAPTTMWIDSGIVRMSNVVTAPSASITNSILFYAQSGELKVRDDAGNVTTLSPHDPDGLPNGLPDMHWSYHSEKDGKYIAVDMYKLAELVEKLSGEKLIYTGKTKDLK